jgi:putative ABC transport system permease protein
MPRVVRWVHESLAEFGRRLRVLFRTEQIRQDLDDEMRLHLDLREREHRDVGLSAVDAGFVAQQRFGNTLQLRERGQDMWGWSWFENLRQDLRFAVRTLTKNPAFTVSAIVCLTLGIGATTCIFTVVNAVLLRPLPYVHPEQLVRLYSDSPDSKTPSGHRFWISGPEFLDLRKDTRSWQSIDAWITSGANLVGESQPIRITRALVSGGLLDSLGVQPAMGRIVSPSDDLPGATPVADISYGIWKSLYGGDPNVVGRETLLSGRKFIIVGVMPPGFQFPPGEVDPAQMWSALQINSASPGSRTNHNLYLLGRLKPGVTLTAAQGELASLMQTYSQNHASNTHYINPQWHRVASYSLESEVVSGVRLALLMLLGAVVFVLLIACANVANLLLARAEARRREIALRRSLGASTWRLAQQFATEGAVLALAGAILGTVLAVSSLRLIQLTNAGSLPRAAELGMNLSVLLLTLGGALLTGIIFGLSPFIPLLLEHLAESLKNTGSGTTSGSGSQVFRRVLVAGEISLAMVLLIGCGLMVRAFWKLQEVRTGVEPKNVITMRVVLPGASYPHVAQIDGFWTRLLERLPGLPGVESSALVWGLPPMRPPDGSTTGVEGYVSIHGPQTDDIQFYQFVSKDYFKTMGIRLMEGRTFDERDVQSGPDTVVVNQTMARTFWPNEDAIGRRVQPSNGGAWCTIVGVVEDVKNAGLDRPTSAELYLPYAQEHGSGRFAMYIVMRASTDPGLLIPEVRRELASMDPMLPLAQVRLMDDVLGASRSRSRFLTLMLSIFSGVALTIAAVGIYGVISYSVARRSKEFGLRMAIGARPVDVLKLVMKQGAVMAMTGIVVGLVVAFALTRLMTSFLFGVKPTDPLTFAIVTLLLAGVALSASYVPARRATKVDPITTLRYE